MTISRWECKLKVDLRTGLAMTFISLSMMTMTAGVVHAQAEKSPTNTPAYGHPPVDFVQTAQKKIDELKTKLNLDPAQMSAWNAWAGKAIDNAKKRQDDLEKARKDWGSGKQEDLTTPQRMDQQIEALGKQIERMQGRLAMLKDSKTTTDNLYAALNKNQKTIFDLYWEKSRLHPRHMGPMGSGGPMGHPGMMPPPRPQ